MYKTSHQAAKRQGLDIRLKERELSQISWACLKIIYMKRANQNVDLFKSDQLTYMPLAFTSRKSEYDTQIVYVFLLYFFETRI